MAASQARAFELVATVNFPTVPASELSRFAAKLGSAVGSILADYPAARAFLVEVDGSTDDITFGVRFEGADPRYIDDMADEILERSVQLVAEREGSRPVKTEREESVLVLA